MEQVLPDAPEGWVNLAALANELERYYPTLREFLKRLPETEFARVSRASGGQPEWWVSLAAADEIRRHYRRVRRAESGGAQQARSTLTHARPTMVGMVGETDVLQGGASEHEPHPDTEAPKVAGMHEASVVKDAASVDQERSRVGQERASLAQERSSLEQAWEAALRQASLRAEAAEALAGTLRDERDRLLDESTNLRERVGELERRADVAETQVRRAREDADRFRAELERTRIAWHDWRGLLVSARRWQLWRRNLPPLPAEFTAGPALAKPTE